MRLLFVVLESDFLVIVVINDEMVFIYYIVIVGKDIDGFGVWGLRSRVLVLEKGWIYVEVEVLRFF